MAGSLARPLSLPENDQQAHGLDPLEHTGDDPRVPPKNPPVPPHERELTAQREPLPAYAAHAASACA